VQRGTCGRMCDAGLALIVWLRLVQESVAVLRPVTLLISVLVGDTHSFELSADQFSAVRPVCSVALDGVLTLNLHVGVDAHLCRCMCFCVVQLKGVDCLRVCAYMLQLPAIRTGEDGPFLIANTCAALAKLLPFVQTDLSVVKAVADVPKIPYVRPSTLPFVWCSCLGGFLAANSGTGLRIHTLRKWLCRPPSNAFCH